MAVVSVRRFVQDEPALFEASRQFVNLLAKVSDPVLFLSRKADSVTASIAWTILGTDLFQDCSYGKISLLLRTLYEKFPGEKLWTLPVPNAHDINSVVESVFGGRKWSLFEHVAGIFWSVGLFVRHHPDLVNWVENSTAEDMWRDLGEIYFMGKSNPRPKACAAIYRIIASSPFGLGIGYRKSSAASDSLRKVVRQKLPPLPLTMGARRFLAILGPAREANFSEMEIQEKQKLANTFFKALSPENPYKASHALQFFLEEGKSDFICREGTRQCVECPLYEFCNYGEHHR